MCSGQNRGVTSVLSWCFCQNSHTDPHDSFPPLPAAHLRLAGPLLPCGPRSPGQLSPPGSGQRASRASEGLRCCVWRGSLYPDDVLSCPLRCRRVSSVEASTSGETGVGVGDMGGGGLHFLQGGLRGKTNSDTEAGLGFAEERTKLGEQH